MIDEVERSGMIAAVALRLLYLIFHHVLELVLLMGRTSSTKVVELLVLRHEVGVLRRTHPRPRLNWADRVVFAALIRRLPSAPHIQAVLTCGYPDGRCRRAAPSLASRNTFSIEVRCRYQCSTAAARSPVDTSRLVTMNE